MPRKQLLQMDALREQSERARARERQRERGRDSTYRPVAERAVRPAYALSRRLRHSPVNLDGHGSATTKDCPELRANTHHSKDQTAAPQCQPVYSSVGAHCVLCCLLAYLSVSEVVEKHAEVSFTGCEVKSAVHAVDVECHNVGFRA